MNKGCGWFLGVIFFGGLYIAAVVFFFTVIGPYLLVAVAAAALLYVVAQYQRILFGVMVESAYAAPAPLAFTPPETASENAQPAYRQYFFGQATTDLRHVIQMAWDRSRQNVTLAATKINDFAFDGAVPAIITWPIALTLFIGLAIGTVVGALVLFAIVALHATTVFITKIVAMTIAYVLQYADIGLRRARKIEVLCPGCHHNVKFPAYRCPSGSCHVLHNDVRPGQYGVLKRVCRCETKFPTLIMLGSHRLEAACPKCGIDLARNVGTAPEVVLPVLGPTAAGKTRLMASIILALEASAASVGGTFEFADEHTSNEFDRVRPLLMAGDHTRATQVRLPRAYSVYSARRSGPKRLLHIFDPAGELLSTTDRMQEQGYLRSANCFTFVIDLMTVRRFWDSLNEQRQDALSTERPEMGGVRPPDEVFANAVDNLRRLDIDTNSCKLAVCFSKSDLLQISSDKVGPVETWLEQDLGLGNMCRSMRANFGEVDFFFTTAMTSGGAPDESIGRYLQWILGPQVFAASQASDSGQR